MQMKVRGSYVFLSAPHEPPSLRQQISARIM